MSEIKPKESASEFIARRDAEHAEEIRVARWHRTQVDHGYNATPVWGLLGRLVAGSGPVTEGRILALRLLDPLLLASLSGGQGPVEGGA